MGFEKLARLVDDFIVGRDRSKHCAGEIEVLLDAFDDREPFATAAHMLASYDGTSGEFMYGAETIATQLRLVATALRST